MSSWDARGSSRCSTPAVASQPSVDPRDPEPALPVGKVPSRGADASSPDPDANLVQIGASVLAVGPRQGDRVGDRRRRATSGATWATRKLSDRHSARQLRVSATINDDDLGAAMEVTKVLDMRLTERMMLESMFTARREEGEGQRDGGSEAGDKDDDGGSHPTPTTRSSTTRGTSRGRGGGIAEVVGRGSSVGWGRGLGRDGCPTMTWRRCYVGIPVCAPWMGTIDPWEARVWYIAMACIAIHGFTTRGTAPGCRRTCARLSAVCCPDR